VEASWEGDCCWKSLIYVTFANHQLIGQKSKIQAKLLEEIFSQVLCYHWKRVRSKVDYEDDDSFSWEVSYYFPILILLSYKAKRFLNSWTASKQQIQLSLHISVQDFKKIIQFKFPENATFCYLRKSLAFQLKIPCSQIKLTTNF